MSRDIVIRRDRVLNRYENKRGFRHNQNSLNLDPNPIYMILRRKRVLMYLDRLGL